MARQGHSYENYEFLDLIGIGSFGSVHKAQNKNTNEIVKYMQLYL
jgi:serine/threonine protein kinase